jgi:uncharacterized membrane protein YedE/YeeE
VGAGIPSGAYGLLGALIGGAFWAQFGAKLHIQRKQEKSIAARLGVRDQVLRAAYVAACAAAVALAAWRDSVSGTKALVGGTMIVVAQVITAVLTGSSIGVSGVYEDLGKVVVRLVLRKTPERSDGIDKVASAPLFTNSVLFALGILGGSYSVAKLAPAYLDAGVAGEAVEVSKLAAATGGFLMAVGSRIAGGCTSGHGISGMAQFGTSSFVSVAAMFAGAFATAAQLRT